MPTGPPPQTQLDWLCEKLDTIVLPELQLIRLTMEATMATLADLTAAVAQIDSKVDALIAAYEDAKNNPDTHFSPEDQAALDAAVSGLQSQLAEVDASNPPA